MANGPAAWLPLAQFAGTVFLGTGAFFVAYRQWRTANNRVRIDLFEKRLKAFNEFTKIVDAFCNDGNLANHYVHNMFALQRGSRILFGKDYVGQLSNCVSIIEKEMLSPKFPDAEAHATSVKLMKKEQKRLFITFERYAGLSKIR